MFIVALLLVAGPLRAQTSGNADAGGANPLQTGTVTGLPIPRFVSLKADRVNLRRGPSRSHQVEWVLLHSGLPVEITAEFENWRRVRDHAGDEGWVFHTLLSGRRTALFAPWSDTDELIDLRQLPNTGAPVRARVGSRVIGDVSSCDNGWCEIDLEQVRGWVSQDQLWGVYPGERVR